ncbi:Predicted PurR-regulated permease PerM [Filimonas lacunae]|uniref:Predicted PurR-regulated permease PerM n=1 Tax=Filimonas lacunae TaxID=477680 RepID=A0A173MLM1_9BACT|nr:AI-2E family transporter [Filimonas lacunae]BAV08545.1 permease [Filimonas lacunae]SIS56765.1 Predicted PurR-regulated permease PerM [Filimonas lacunae]
MNNSTLPLTVRRSIEMLGLFLVGALVMLASDVIMPIILSFFLALVLLPVCRFLDRLKVPRAISIVLAIILLVIVVGFFGWLFFMQINKLIIDFPTIKANMTQHVNHLSEWVDKKGHFSTQQQTKMINEQSNKLLNYAGGVLGGVATSATSVLLFFGLIPIYIFFLLYYKNLLLNFVFLWFKRDHHAKVQEVVHETEAIIKSYIGGLLIQITYMSFLLGIALTIFGIKHALLIAIIFAFLNLIPYIGALIGNVIGILLTISSSQEMGPVLTVLIIIAVVQFLDNNILMPRIVGSKVKINALVSIIAVFLGGKLAGISGMFLSLPIIAILKIIFDRTEMFRQWGVLFGEEQPEKSPLKTPATEIEEDTPRPE